MSDINLKMIKEFARQIKETIGEPPSMGKSLAIPKEQDRRDLLKWIHDYHPVFQGCDLATTRIAVAFKPDDFGAFGTSRTCYWLLLTGSRPVAINFADLRESVKKVVQDSEKIDLGTFVDCEDF